MNTREINARQQQRRLGATQAIRWHGQLDVRIDDIEPPDAPAPGDVQVRVLACGICGTDTEEFAHGPIFIPTSHPHSLTGRMAPITLGHEVCGQVVAVGDSADEALLGRLVAVDGLITCGTCWACQQHRVNLCDQLASIGFSADGGLTSALNVPARGCLPLAENVEADVGALAEPLAVGLRALRRGRFVRGEKVVVVGGGAIGQLGAQAALALGACDVVLVEPDPDRRRSATAAGLPTVIDSSAAAQAGGDIVLECSGTGAGITTSVAATRPTGRVVLVGITSSSPPLPALSLVRKEQEIIGSLSHVYDEDFAAAVELINKAEIGRNLCCVVTSLDEAIDYLTGVMQLPGGVVKAIVRPAENGNPFHAVAGGPRP